MEGEWRVSRLLVRAHLPSRELYSSKIYSSQILFLSLLVMECWRFSSVQMGFFLLRRRNKKVLKWECVRSCCKRGKKSRSHWQLGLRWLDHYWSPWRRLRIHAPFSRLKSNLSTGVDQERELKEYGSTWKLTLKGPERKRNDRFVETQWMRI